MVSNSPVLQSMLQSQQTAVKQANTSSSVPQSNALQDKGQETKQPQVDAFVSKDNKNKTQKLLKRLGIGGAIGAGVGALSTLGYFKLVLKRLSVISKLNLDSTFSKVVESVANSESIATRKQFIKDCAETGVDILEQDGKVVISESAAKELLEQSKSMIKKAKPKAIAIAAGVCGAIGLGIGAIVHAVKSNKENKAEKQ